jgi:large subunit ribosomal protein L32e
MAEAEKKATKRSKPKFLRTDWHKKIRLGRGVKKNQKWHGAKGRQNKLRLNRKGRMQRPKIGWGAEGEVKGFVGGVDAVRVENVKMLEDVKKGQGVIVASVGKKNKDAILAKAKEKGIKVLNRYKKAEAKDAAK